MNRKDDLKVLTESKPFIRGALAFLVYLVKAKHQDQIDDCYATVDVFLKHLEEDLNR